MQTLTATQLVSLGRDINTPFLLNLDPSSLSLLSNEGPILDTSVIEIVQCLRLVPKTRLVALARSDADTELFVVKIFFQTVNHQRHLSRDRQGCQLLRDAGIAIPELLFEANLEDGAACALGFQYLHGGKGLGSALAEAKTVSQQQSLRKTAVKIIADCHNLGLWQQDIHPENFIVLNNTLYMLDGADVQKQGSTEFNELEYGENVKTLSSKKSFENLALFFAQFEFSNDRNLPELYKHYLEQRKFQLTDYPLEWFSSQVRQARGERIIKYEKKLLRETTEHICLQNRNSFVVFDRTLSKQAVAGFLEDPDAFIHKNNLLKDGNTSSVANVKLGDNTYVLKRYNNLGVWHSLKRSVSASRARKSWLAANLLKMLGVESSHPYLVLELVRFGIIRYQSYFLCEELAGDTVEKVIKDSGFDKQLAMEIFRQFHDLFNVFHDYRISHGDFKASNFIYDAGTLKVIDLDSMKWHRSYTSFLKHHKKDKKRFLKNWVGTAVESQARQILG